MNFGTGLTLNATEDASALRDTARALEAGGLDYVTIGGHVLSTEEGRFPDRPSRNYVGPFHDPFVLFAHLAAVTSRLRFRTGIVILPQLPTGLVAQQAAELSALSDGRFELGVGLSWNEAEYAALGQDASTRGRRMEEQLPLLRRLWSERYVEFHGAFHDFDRVGLNRTVPPIPIWIGSTADPRPLRRAARHADGWIPMGRPSDEALAQLRAWLVEEGRDPASFGLTLGLVLEGGASDWVAAARDLAQLGATHLGLTAPAGVEGAAAQRLIIEATGVLKRELG
ncbi:MAG: TIGR03619 family F420-dependent LLM class oxidoreductase, partial [Dehalococcoidia bacterium]